MKKLVTFVFYMLMVLFMSAPFSGTAEAAYVAVVPIDIDTAKVERASDLTSYYWDLIVEKFKYPEYELLDDDKVAAALPDDGLKTFDQATLAGIAEKLGAEVVVAMRITEVKETPKSFLREPAVLCHMKGEFASLNTMRDKKPYYNNKFNYDEQIEAILTVRNDWLQNAFAYYTRRGINRTMDLNKK